MFAAGLVNFEKVLLSRNKWFHGFQRHRTHLWRRNTWNSGGYFVAFWITEAQLSHICSLNWPQRKQDVEGSKGVLSQFHTQC